MRTMTMINRVRRLACFSLLLLLALPVDAQRQRPREPGPGAIRENHEAFPEQRDEVVQFIREVFPEKARLLERLKRDRPGEFQMRRQRLVEEVRGLMQLQERNPELFKIQVEEMRLRDELNRLARETRSLKTGSKERVEQEKRLREALAKSYDLRQQVKQGELNDLKARIAELESSLKRRTDRRNQLIEERFQQMVGSDEEDW